MESKRLMELTEATLDKVGAIASIANKAIEIPLNPINTLLDKIEEPVLRTKLGRQTHKRLYTDPSVQSRKLNAKEWAGLMAGGSAASHLVAGDVSAPVMAGLAGVNAIKGSAIGPLLTGGKDTLLKNVAVPAGVVAVGTQLVNDGADALDIGQDIDFEPGARAGAAATFGTGLWALRNRKNKDRRYY